MAVNVALNMAAMVTPAPVLKQRQNVNPTGIAGCTNYDLNAVESCYENVLGTAYPTCYDFSQNGCCKNWLSWYQSDFSCLQTAYSNCFDFTDYLSGISDILPCYSGVVFTSTQKKPSNAAATTTSIPQLSLEAITYGTPTETPSHASISSYTGSGALLQGYCNTPNYVLLDGPTAFWAPVVGCVGDKTDCCPYSVRQTTATVGVTVYSTVTVNVGAGGVATAYTGQYGYPQAASPQLATLQRCPGDYVAVQGGCCPSGYQLWNAAVGGAVPCYSSLDNTLTPPVFPIPGVATITGSADGAAISAANSAAQSTTTSTSSTSTYSPTDSKPTSAIVNVVYAVQYPLATKSSLTTGAKAGIGAGTGAAAVLIIVLALLLIRKYRSSRKDKQMIAQLSTPGTESHFESQPAMSTTNTMSPYSYSTRTELHSDGIGAGQTPNSNYAVPQAGYFPPQVPMYQPGGIDQQPSLSPTSGQMQRLPVPGQEMYAPPESSVSPQSDVNSMQSGYGYQSPQQQQQQQQQQTFYPPAQQMGTQGHYQVLQAPHEMDGTGQGVQIQPQQHYVPPVEMGHEQPQQHYIPPVEMGHEQPQPQYAPPPPQELSYEPQN